MTISEKDIVRLVARFVPWLAPIPSAWLVGRAVLAHLGFPLAVAIVTAATVEGLGLVSVFNWQWFSDWERKRLSTDVPAQPWQPAVLGAFYLLLTTGLVVILDVLPALATYAPAALPALALVGTINLALIAGQEQRELDAEAAKQARARKRQENVAKKAANGKTAKRQKLPVAAKTTRGNATRQEAAVILAAMPDITGAELGRQLGKSERLGRLLKSELVPADGNGKDG